ncbi:MAG: Rrf2 family transcriptional regulator [Spirochaetia bacterium]|nr:Rrf2 family transcriptional regulator [Spirochaetia bacterium]
MRITSKGRYGLKAMMDLAQAWKTQSLRKTREIAETRNVPLKYLEQIINILKKGDLVSSVRGAEGGYRLARSPETITVYEILRTLEGDLSILDARDMNWQGEQGTFWNDLEGRIKAMLEIPLSEFVDAGTAAHGGLMYYI